MTNPTALLLRRARVLIDEPGKWSRYGWGTHGRRCLLHALYDAAGGNPYRPARLAVESAAGIPESADYLGDWNDTHTHAEVLAVLDRAIEEAERE